MKPLQQRTATPLLSPRRWHLVCLTVIAMLVTNCSTTKRIPTDEQLYIGTEPTIIGSNPDSVFADISTFNEVEAIFAYAPNNALLGSSSVRIPFPVGLWSYNALVDKKSKFSEWLFSRLATDPILVSEVNPQLRATIARNMLRESGYFDAETSHMILTNEGDPRKAQVQYSIDPKAPYHLSTIEYMPITSEADALIQQSKHSALIRPGDQFSTARLEQERQRISNLLREEGFYYSRPSFIVYDADTVRAPQKVAIRVKQNPKLERHKIAMQPWRISEIEVVLNGMKNEAPTDSVYYNNLLIRYRDKLRIRPEVLYDRVRLRPDSLFRESKQHETMQALARLNAFRFTEMQFAPDTINYPLDSARLRMRINTAYDLPYDSELELNVTTKSNDQAGPGARFALTKRNLFGGGETLGLELTGSYEWQTRKGHESRQSLINSWELGASATLQLPEILFPGYRSHWFEYPVHTSFRLYGNQLNRAGFFKMLSFGGSVVYDFKLRPHSTHHFTPLRLTFNRLQHTTAQFDSITTANPSLYESLRDQFIPAMSYSYTYEQGVKNNKWKNHLWWQSTITESGNLLSAAYAIAGKPFKEKDKQILDNPFAQFLKLTSEVRYNYRIDNHNRVVGRVFAGAIAAFGNSRTAPYSEQFYVGGANSLRGFTIRSIGPGAHTPDPTSQYAYVDQTGDLKFEANLEYRFRIFQSLKGAAFIDAGNVWLLRDNPERPNSTMVGSRLLNDLALNTGFGLRFDIELLVLRLDLGIPLHIPYDTGKEGYYNIPSFSQGLRLHIAVGYPF